ncbi:iron-containing alcohol dehydrogenase [candidate division WOR-3 bacterium]|uniref:Iron-containing alcohol dehydrogenase n=1 Tax=candidate division WOR-3 bacterium TaxID=2052148 RepID=A0A9D5KAQ4_UNCW3|nr:iron-containing alcohol dehydrogenase [candidate division WOR-3 bacterium]MBD3364675.1 iron-containing alcohol dehydrogenase [candidate division WOR-3 bacterium]
MPIFCSSVTLPIQVRIEEKLLDLVSKLMCESNLLFARPLIVTMGNISHLAERVRAGFENSPTVKRLHTELIESNAYPEVERIEGVIDEFKPDVLIGVGGGRVIDVSKFTAARRMLPVVSVPTSLSNDGISSPVAVIRFRKESRSVGVNVPAAVLIDLEADRSAPKQNLKSGVGDLLSNISATNDWISSYRKTHEHYDTVAALLSRKSAFEMLDSKRVNFDDISFLQILAEGLVLSGIAMGIAGTSRPCSGSEHLLSHAYDELYPDSPSLHGEQVAMFSVFTSYLQEEHSWSALADFLKRNELISTPKDLGIDFDTFLKVLELAPSTRPGRHTILDGVSEGKVKKAYSKAYSRSK